MRRQASKMVTEPALEKFRIRGKEKHYIRDLKKCGVMLAMDTS